MPVFLVRKFSLCHSISEGGARACVMVAANGVSDLKKGAASAAGAIYGQHLPNQVRNIKSQVNKTNCCNNEDKGFEAETLKYGDLYEAGLPKLAARANRAGLKLPTKPKLNERGRTYAESVTFDKNNKGNSEGQDKSLKGAGERRKHMASKLTALVGEGVKGVDRSASGYTPLKGNAFKDKEKSVSDRINRGQPQLKHRVLLNQQRQAIETHVRSSVEKIIDALCQGDTTLESLGNPLSAVEPVKAKEILKALGVRKIQNFHIDTLSTLKSEIRNLVPLGGSVCEVFDLITDWAKNVDKTYSDCRQTNGTFNVLDHKLGQQVNVSAEELANNEKHKALQLFLEQVMDQEIEKEMASAVAKKRLTDIRYSGNSFNVPGLYGAPQAGFDGAREASFRVSLRMTAKNAVLRHMDDLARLPNAGNSDSPLKGYIDKLPDKLVKEFLDKTGWNEPAYNTQARRQAQRRAKLFELLTDQRAVNHPKIANCTAGLQLRLSLIQQYPAQIQGPCGTLQAGLNHVGDVLTALQHITGETSLWCHHNGDFKEVAGLQGHEISRTHMKLIPGTEMFNMYQTHKDLQKDKNGNLFIPTDCVHSQNYLNLPGFEQEATAMLRTILSDIVPDVTKLKVRLTGTATMGAGADKAFAANGEARHLVTGSSRFAQEAHEYKVTDDGDNSATRGQEDLVIEGAEFVFDDAVEGVSLSKPKVLFSSTQHHDDASKGTDPTQEYGDDSYIEKYEQLPDGAERTLMFWCLSQSQQDFLLRRGGNQPAAQPVTTNASNPKKVDEYVDVVNRVAGNLSNYLGAFQQRVREAKLNELTSAFNNRRWVTARFGEGAPETILFDLLRNQSDTSNNQRLSLQEICEKDDNFWNNAIKSNWASDCKVFSLPLLDGVFSREENKGALHKKHLEHVANSLFTFLARDNNAASCSSEDVAQRGVQQLSQPRKGWQVNDRGDVGVPTGISGAVAVPTGAGTAANIGSVGLAAGGVATTGLGTAAVAGTTATGVGLMGMGATILKSGSNTYARLKKISADHEIRFKELEQTIGALRGDATLRQQRGEKFFAIDKMLKGQSGSTNENNISQIISNTRSAIEDLSVKQANGKVSPLLKPEVKANALAALEHATKNLDQMKFIAPIDREIFDVRVQKEALEMISAVNQYIDVQIRQQLNENKKVIGPKECQPEHRSSAQNFLSNCISEMSHTLQSKEFVLEQQLVDELEMLFNQSREIDRAKKDNMVYRFTGSSYLGSGAAYTAAAVGGFVAAPATAGASLALAGGAILGSGFAANYLNTRREAKSIAKSLLDIDAEHRQPWAPKVVGLHRDMLNRRNEQVEAARSRGNGMSWRNMGWKSGLLAIGALTASSALIAGTFGLAAIPLAGAVALYAATGVSSGVLARSTYNLFNRHSARASAFGPKVEQTPHLQGLHNSGERKRFYWSGSKMSAQIAEKKAEMLERIGNRKSGPLQRSSVMYDMRHPINYFLDRFIAPNQTPRAQAKAIRNELQKDFMEELNLAKYSLELYTDHELNFIRDKLATLEARSDALDDQIKSLQQLGERDSLIRKLDYEKTRNERARLETKNALDAVYSFKQQHEAFKTLQFNSLNNIGNAGVRAELEDKFKDLIVDFNWKMGLLPRSRSRGSLEKLAKEHSGDGSLIRLHYGDKKKFIAGVDMNRSASLPEDLRNELKTRAYKDFANLMVFTIPDLMNYEINKVMSDELRTRKPIERATVPGVRKPRSNNSGEMERMRIPNSLKVTSERVKTLRANS